MKQSGRRGTPWTPAENDALRDLDVGFMSNGQIAVELGNMFRGRTFTAEGVGKRIARMREEGSRQRSSAASPAPATDDRNPGSGGEQQALLEALEEMTRRRPMTTDALAAALEIPTGDLQDLLGVAARQGRRIDVDDGPEGRASRPPRGPTAAPHYIPDGHELGGVSRLTDGAGKVSAEWSKTRVAGADEPPTPVPESFLLDKVSKMQRGDGSTVVEWSSYRRGEVEQWEAIKVAVVQHVAEYVRPSIPAEAPTSTDEDLLVAYPLGDPHIGMLAWANEVGEHFDLRIAERELCECMRQLVARSPAAHEAIVCNLGDFWHAQDDNQRTPQSGNKLDVDGRAGKVGQVGLSIFRSLVDTALTRHRRVRVRSIPGNHDPNSSFWLPEFMRATYANEPRVVVEEGFSPYQYDVFGKNLLGWAHGDGAKLEDLGEIMATDVPEMWGATMFREWNSGHVHHLIVKELRGCVVRTHRTLAGRDAWHFHSGYRSRRSLQALAYHRRWGLDSVATVGVERVRAALEGAA